jgi:hypothetical protein
MIPEGFHPVGITRLRGQLRVASSSNDRSTRQFRRFMSAGRTAYPLRSLLRRMATTRSRIRSRCDAKARLPRKIAFIVTYVIKPTGSAHTRWFRMSMCWTTNTPRFRFCVCPLVTSHYGAGQTQSDSARGHEQNHPAFHRPNGRGRHPAAIGDLRSQ